MKKYKDNHFTTNSQYVHDNQTFLIKKPKNIHLSASSWLQQTTEYDFVNTVKNTDGSCKTLVETEQLSKGLLKGSNAVQQKDIIPNEEINSHYPKVTPIRLEKGNEHQLHDVSICRVPIRA